MIRGLSTFKLLIHRNDNHNIMYCISILALNGTIVYILLESTRHEMRIHIVYCLF